MKRFETKDKGDLKMFLGIEINYNKNENILRLNQKRYITNLLKKFEMENCKSISTPIEYKLQQTTEGQKTNKPYRELLGCLMYLSGCTRPDICFSVNYFSKFQENPTEEAWKGLKRILRYLKGNINLELEYKKEENIGLQGFADADWGNDIDNRKSISGACIK